MSTTPIDSMNQSGYPAAKNMNQKTRHVNTIQKVLRGILRLNSSFTVVELGKQANSSMRETRSVLIRLVALGVLKQEKAKNASWIYHVINKDYLKNGYQPQKGIW